MLVNDILSISVWNIKARKIRFHCGLKWNILSISMCILSLYFCVCIISVHLFQVWLLKRCRGLDCVPCFLRGKLWRFLFSGFFSAWYHYWFCVVYIAAACIPCLLWEHSHQPMLSRQINIVRSKHDHKYYYCHKDTFYRKNILSDSETQLLNMIEIYVYEMIFLR